jgi:UDP:flavonoid glycosyltransferase YjiC (YdhE family)
MRYLDKNPEQIDNQICLSNSLDLMHVLDQTLDTLRVAFIEMLTIMINILEQMNQKKILFATMPMDGHFNPLTGIAMHFKTKGHDVRWYCSQTYENKLQKLGILLYPYKRAREVNSQNLHKLYPEISKFKGPKLIKFAFEKVFLDNIENHYLDVQEIFENEFEFDMFFCDGALYALQMINEKIGKPVYVIGPAPLLATSKDTPPNFIGLTPAKTVLGKKIHQSMRYFMDKMIFTDGQKVYNNVRISQGLPSYNASFWDISTDCSTLYFQSGVPEFEYYRSDLNPKVKFVGALIPYKSVSDKEFKYPEKLKQFEKIILISQGTIDNKDQDKLIIPVLNALKDKNYLLIVTTGSISTDELRKKYNQHNIIIEDFIDFDFILDYTDLYITNGGYGGVMLSLSKGVPILTAGISEGKNDINAHIRYFKLGVDLRTEKPTPGKIKIKAKEILEETTYKKNVSKLQSVLKSYNANQIIEDFVLNGRK